MKNHEREFMEEAIRWAEGCNPIKASIPKVGAIIALGQNAIGRGRRGTGEKGDDDHAEWHAIHDVKEKSNLADATLYTTLEPCTKEVRSNPLECCTERILQFHIPRVFVGILDPNQGVTGKGLLRLQESNIDVGLFHHDLSKQIRIQNAAFILTQQTLGATILTPADGEELKTYETGGKHTIRLKCLNPPGPDTYLLINREGLCWPQGGPFRPAGKGLWEIDAHFGSTGEHVLQLITANNLGSALIHYYQKVTQENRSRRSRLRDKVDASLLGVDHPGIVMSGGLPKGIRLEASVAVYVAYKVNVVQASFEPKTISRRKTGKITYEIESAENASQKIWLGASFQDKTGKYFYNTNEDKLISLKKGMHSYSRNFTIQRDAPLGQHMLRVNVWRGPVGDSNTSKRIASGAPVQIAITE